MTDDSAPREGCSSCGKPKPRTLKFFSPDKKNSDKLCSNCKQCRNEKGRAKRQAEKEANAIPLPPVPEGHKRCRECKAIKLATTEFFNAVPAYISLDCLNRQCIECRKKYRRGCNKSSPRVIKPKSEKKWCAGCEKWKFATLEYFSYNRHTGDRLAERCKQCSRQNSKAYRARPGGLEARQEYRKATYDPEKRRTRRITHQDEEIATHKRWYATHKQQHKAYQDTYMQVEANREAKRVRTLNRIARKKAILGTHTAAQIAEQLKRQHYHCYYAACGFSKFPRIRKNGTWKYLYHIEHTFPIDRVAGTSIPANDIGYIVLACESCNLSKGNKFPWEWMEGGRLL